MSSHFLPNRFWRRWTVAMATVSAVFTLALLPPFVPETWHAVLMQAFGSVCHQIPERSPHWGGVPIAVCDRCIGIYAGLLLGIAGGGVIHTLLSKVYKYAPWVLAMILLPLAADWVGPVLGAWANTPVSRGGTGLFVGVGAGLLIVAALGRSPTGNASGTTASAPSQ